MNISKPATTSPSLSVMIVGGGLGGLALAQGLAARGVTATVFERDPGAHDRTQGYRISVNQAGYDALKWSLPPALFDQFPKLEVRGVGREFQLATSSMSSLLRFRRGEEVGAITVSRPGLRRFLSTGLDVRWNKKMVSFREIQDGTPCIEATFADGTTHRADLLVGCDGVNSWVREQMRAQLQDKPASAAALPTLSNIDLVSVGAQVPRTPELERDLPLNRNGAVYYLGSNGDSMFVSLCEDESGQPLILWAQSRHEKLDISAEKKWKQGAWTAEGRAKLLQGCIDRLNDSDWHPSLRKMVRETSSDSIVDSLVLKAMSIPKTRVETLWPSGRVTLLGDSAHAMPPHRGIGGNTAFVDARALTELLCESSSAVSLKARISKYEVELLNRGSSAVEQSLESAQMFHMSGFAGKIRNFVLRTIDAVLGLKERMSGRRALRPATVPSQIEP